MFSTSMFKPTEWSNLIKVLVGPDEQPFDVHKCVLDTIPFFRACLNNGFQKGDTRSVKLPKDDVDAFSEVLRWAYETANLISLTRGRNKLSSDFTITTLFTADCESPAWFSQLSAVEQRVGLLLSTYTFARKLGIEYLPNAIIDELNSYKSLNMTSTTAELVYLFDTEFTEELLYDFLFSSLTYGIRALGWDFWKAANPGAYDRFFANKPANIEKVFAAFTKTSVIRPPGRLRELKPCRWHLHNTSTCIATIGRPVVTGPYPPAVQALVLHAPKSADAGYEEYKQLYDEYVAQRASTTDREITDALRGLEMPSTTDRADPTYAPTSPDFSLTGPKYSPASLATPNMPSYAPTSPVYNPTAPTFNPRAKARRVPWVPTSGYNRDLPRIRCAPQMAGGAAKPLRNGLDRGLVCCGERQGTMLRFGYAL